jgi:hypothetical protein
MIDNREYTQLSYLAAYLIKFPNKWEDIYNIMEKSKTIPPSIAFQKALDSFSDLIKKIDFPNKQDVKEIAEKLLSSEDEDIKDMGRAISCALSA